MGLYSLSGQHAIRGITVEGMGKVKYEEDQEERTEIQTQEFLDFLQNAAQTQLRH